MTLSEDRMNSARRVTEKVSMFKLSSESSEVWQGECVHSVWRLTLWAIFSAFFEWAI
jgi:hypothetical protein